MGAPAPRRRPRAAKVLILGLAAQSGFVDAVAYILLGGFFVSFISGDSTRFAVDLARRPADAGIAGALIAAFVLGVFAFSLLGEAAGRRRPLVVALAVATTLALSRLALLALPAFPSLLLLALASGGADAVLTGREEAPVGVTYMTGALTKSARALAARCFGRGGAGLEINLGLWAAFVAGALAGALAERGLGAGALTLAAAFGLLLAGLAARVPEPGPQAG